MQETPQVVLGITRGSRVAFGGRAETNIRFHQINAVALVIPNWCKTLMFHLVWYILVGLIAGVVAKSVMHVHMLLIWTIVLGIIGGILGGAVTHLFAPPTSERFHPAGLILSTLGAIVVLYVCIKLGIRFPRVG